MCTACAVCVLAVGVALVFLLVQFPFEGSLAMLAP